MPLDDDRLRRWSRVVAAPALWTVYLAWPVRGWGLVEGLPLSPLATGAIAALWLAQVASPRKWSVRWPVAFVLLKLAISPALVDHGFVADYFSNSAFTPPAERSVEFPRAPFTRIDKYLDFGPGAGRDLPLFFLNDARFAGHALDAPYAVSWTGRLRVADDRQVLVFLHGKGVSGDVAIDGTSIVTLGPDEGDRRAPVVLRAGWRQLRIAASAAVGGGRAIYAGTIDASGVDRGFGAADVYRREVAGWQVALDRTARTIGWMFDLIAFIYFGVQVGIGLAQGLSITPSHAVFVGLATIVAIEAIRSAWPMADHLLLFGPASRMSGLEAQARGALLNGWTSSAGRYPSLYVLPLALLHEVFGEGTFGVALVRPLAVGLPIVAVAWLVDRFGRRRDEKRDETARARLDIGRVLTATGIVLSFVALPHRITGDAGVRFDALESLLDHGTLSSMSYSMVGPIFAAPLFYLGKLAFEPGWWCARYNTVILAGTLLALDRVLRDRVDRRLLHTFFVVLVAASMFPNHLSDFYSEVFTAACIAVGAAALAVDRTALGWALVVLGVVNTPAALVGLAFVAVRETWNRRQFRHLVPVVAAAALIALEAWVRRGSPFVTGYEGNAGFPTILPFSGRPGFSFPLFFGLLSILFSFGKGLVFFAPGLLLPVRTDDRSLGQPLHECYRTWMLMLAGLILVYAKWWSWYGGWWWGPRFFLFASVPASLAVAVKLREAPRLRTRALLAVAAALTLSAWVGVSGAVFSHSDLDICLQHDFAQEALCWYTPEFSALWRPFVVPTAMPPMGAWFEVFCGLAFLWLSAPLLRPLWSAQVECWRLVRARVGALRF